MNLQNTHPVLNVIRSDSVNDLCRVMPWPFATMVTSLLLLSTISVFGQNAPNPPVLSYNDLVKLYDVDQPTPELQQRLDELLSRPFVDNSASRRGVVPLKPTVAGSGRKIRVASWNIERGLEFDAVKAALTDDHRYFRQIQQKGLAGPKLNLAQVYEESRQLKLADIIILNEVDWGLKRTNYRNVAKDLATACGMNYAYAVEFVEVDPLTLGTETLEGETSADKEEMLKNMAVDKSRTLGLHGTAIFSRFNLKNVRVYRFQNQGHDWYADEKKGTSVLQKGKDKGAGVVFDEKIAREVRRGGRMMILADIEDKDIPGGTATVVATHLEDKTKPENRVKQLEEVFEQTKDITHPVIFAGDMNTSGSDQTPTSLSREVKKRMGSTSFWITKGVKYATGVGLIYDVTLGAFKAGRTYSDPTVKNIKFVSENHEEEFFSTLKKFRFSDGNAFDFRGSKRFSTGGMDGTLSDSNQRAKKGFASTLELIGKVTIPFKLDWIFVKPATLTDPDDNNQSFLFAPRDGRTLKELNYSLKDRISDHNPIITDLGLPQGRSNTVRKTVKAR